MTLVAPPSTRPNLWCSVRVAACWVCAWWTLHCSLWLAVDGLDYSTEPAGTASAALYGGSVLWLAKNLIIGVVVLAVMIFTIGAVTPATADKSMRQQERRIGFVLSLVVLVWLTLNDWLGLVRAAHWLRILLA